MRSHAGAARAVAEAEPAGPPCTSIKDIYRRFQRFVWKKLRRSDIGPASAEGIHQEVFLTLDGMIQKNAIPDDVRALLTTITGHMICNYLRRKARRPEHDDGIDTDALPALQPDAEEQMRGVERKQIVEHILGEMPKKAALLIRWIDLAELTHQEVATILELPIKTVTTQHRRARDRFRVLAERLYKADLGGGS
ncbi:MAG: sigma-70 family RNA polymerase sigma factor [Byssovorax sp.]